MNGTSATGSFSFDDAVVPAGTNAFATGLLSSLDFTWNGIAYTEATANTGAIRRFASGDLQFVMFGTSCSGGSCSLSRGSEGWAFRSGSLNDFGYVVAGGELDGYGTSTTTLRVAQVPEPASLALLGLGFAAMGFARRKRKQ